jgi:hypothetical protein
MEDILEKAIKKLKHMKESLEKEMNQSYGGTSPNQAGGADTSTMAMSEDKEELVLHKNGQWSIKKYKTT